MARGQKKKTLTSRLPTGTGTRKTRNSNFSDSENIPPAAVTPAPTLQRPRPKPTLKLRLKDTYNTATRDEEDTAAARTLVSLQTGQPRAPPSPRINRCIRAALKLPPGADLGDSDELNSDHEDEQDTEDEEEVDELQESSEHEVDELLEDIEGAGTSVASHILHLADK